MIVISGCVLQHNFQGRQLRPASVASIR